MRLAPEIKDSGYVVFVEVSTYHLQKARHCVTHFLPMVRLARPLQNAKAQPGGYDGFNIGGNYSKLAEGLNVASRRVSEPAKSVDALKEAVRVTDDGNPFLLEIVAKEGYDFLRYKLAGL